MLPDYAALAEAIARWAPQAGVPVDVVQLSYHDRPTLVLPLPPGGAGPQSSGEPQAERGQTISQVALDVLAVLEEAGKPLTTTRILEAMAKRKPPMDWSQRSVAEHLARMVVDGTLENVQEGKVRGYRPPS
jgi:hypothetical protein